MKDVVPEPELAFAAGLDLCESFFHEAVEPILHEHFADLRYSAALIGSGSEVLGFDTKMSTDHHWGPRAMLFLSETDLGKYKTTIAKTLSSQLPRKFRGYPTSYSSPEDNGVRLLDYTERGPINHRVEVTSVAAFIGSTLDFDLNMQLTPADWLSFPEQLLRSITAGRVFRDQADLESVRKRFAYYPHDVWLYLLASCWTRIEQEEHLMGRAGFVDDEIGSAIIASRLVRDLMHLCFLMEKSYAPYPKWFGSAFKQLAAASVLAPIFHRVLAAHDWQQRQKHLAQAYEYVAQLHNNLGITDTMPTAAIQFHERPFLVISMGAFSKAITARITDPTIQEIASKPLIGNVDLFSDSTDILSNSRWRAVIRRLYSGS